MASTTTGFTFKREIDLGQALTLLSIAVTALGLGYGWYGDRLLREKEYADRVRRSASVVTAKIERWGELSGRYFEDLQPMLVDVSEKVADTNRIDRANRILYKGLMDAKAKSSQRIVEEQLQIAYMELYGYLPDYQVVFDRTIAEIKLAEHETQSHMAHILQEVLRDPDFRGQRDSPTIGNALRERVEHGRIELARRIREISEPLRRQMLAVIQKTDSDLCQLRSHSTSRAPAKGTSEGSAEVGFDPGAR